MARKPVETGTIEEMFEVELDGIVRDFDPGFGTESYDVSFDCRRTGQSVEVTVAIDAEGVATLEIIPRAMAEMAKVFAALAEQSKAWPGGEG